MCDRIPGAITQVHSIRRGASAAGRVPCAWSTRRRAVRANPPGTRSARGMKGHMRTLLRVLRTIAYTAALFVAALVVGNILYRLLADLTGGMDRSDSAAQGASLLFAVVAVAIAGFARRYRRRRKARAPRPPAPGRRCMKCRAPASADDAFCMRCGTSLAAVPAAETGPPTESEMPTARTVGSAAPVAGPRRSTLAWIAVGSAVVVLTALSLGAAAIFVWLRSGAPALAYGTTGASRAELESATSVLNRRLANAGLTGEARVKGGLILVSLPGIGEGNIASVDQMLRKPGRLEFLPVADQEAADTVSGFAAFLGNGTTSVLRRTDGGFAVETQVVADVKRRLLEEPPRRPLEVIWTSGGGPDGESAWVVDRSQAVDGPRVERAEASANGSGIWTIQLTFANEASGEGGTATTWPVGKTVVWTLDGVFLTAPNMMAPLGRFAALSVGSQEAGARRLAVALASGTLPIELTRVPAAGNR
jgi:hypothetical protein